MLKRDLLTEAIWTKHDNTCTGTQQSDRSHSPHRRFDATVRSLTNGERDGGMEWYKLKNSCSVEESRNAAEKTEQ